MAQRHMDRLTSFDASFLANEKGNSHMAIGAVLVCDGPPPSYEDFLAHVSSRLHLLPRFRQRIAQPPLRLGRPFWVDDAGFDVEAHVRRATLPAPGGEGQLQALAAELLSPSLDRSRPLWGLWLVDGLGDNRFAVVYKTHHALADGIAAVDIGTLLFDAERSVEPVRAEQPWSPSTPPSSAGLLGRALSGLGFAFVRLARWLRGAIRHPSHAGRRVADGAAGLWEVSRALAEPAPKVPLNLEIGAERRVCWKRCDLSEFKRIKGSLGGTVNDVTLAAAAGALRRWLQDRDVDTRGLELKALVPVSVRAENEHGELGNKLTAMRGPLPVGIADPVERLAAIRVAMDGLKTSKQQLGAETIWGLNDWFRDFGPPLLLEPTAALNFSTRLFNLLVTNFPGPQIPIYVLGRKLIEVYPVGFLARRHALSIAIFSYNGQINFGLLADREAVHDAERIASYLGDAVEELSLAAGIASGGDGDELARDLRSRVPGHPVSRPGG
jgi:diacylglycerol O-acyltransferase / wax synthase